MVLQFSDPPRGPNLHSLLAALQELRRIDERCYQIVEMRLLRGLSPERVSAALGLSAEDLELDWNKARAFLFVRSRKSNVATCE